VAETNKKVFKNIKTWHLPGFFCVTTAKPMKLLINHANIAAFLILRSNSKYI
tara:strand:- start:188 stop:343 length:156 start_codon:yes stop_codon:yes gene_type:complete